LKIMVKDYKYASSLAMRAQIEVARRHIDQGEFDDAIQILAFIVDNAKASKYHEVAFRLRGGAYLDSRRWRQAIEDHTKVIELNPRNSISFNERALAYRALNEDEKSYEDFARAIELHPRSTTYLTNRAVNLITQGQYDKALNDIYAALALDQDDVNALHLLSKIDYELGDYEQALKTLNRLIDIHKDRRSLFMDRALTKVELCNWEGAKDDFLEARKLAATVPPIQQRAAYHKTSEIIEGCCLLFVDDVPSAALEFFLRAFGNPTEKVKLHYLIGHAYARQGRADCATEQFRQALASRPQMAPCQRALDALNGVYNDEDCPIDPNLSHRHSRRC